MLQLDELQLSRGLGVVAARAGQPVDGWFCPSARCAVPSVIALLECREALAREELESRLEAVREAEEHVAAARQRVDHARIAREEVLRALAERAKSPHVARSAGRERHPCRTRWMTHRQCLWRDRPQWRPVPVIVGQAVPTGTGGGVDRDQRPPTWQAGLGRT
ncbi:hypothetical protein [Streptacidiphilus sp. EB129]|uniref:hypothetical protein n=1 Tax=Streptacidiphilus sp. EB129 TaxID=3156262 RepID=UPI0035166CF5